MSSEPRDAIEERAREEREEEAYEIEATAVPDIAVPFVAVKTALVRDWVRAMLVPPAVKRLYEIGMGRTRFDVPTAAGNTVRVPAPAAVQVRALQGVIGIGVPQQLGLTGEGDELPGVLAVGEWEMAAVREGVAQGAGESPKLASESSSLSAPAYVPPEGHEVIVVDDEAAVTSDTRAEEPPPPVNPDRNALAKAILAKRRAARSGPHDGPRAGDHPNHT